MTGERGNHLNDLAIASLRILPFISLPIFAAFISYVPVMAPQPWIIGRLLLIGAASSLLLCAVLVRLGWPPAVASAALAAGLGPFGLYSVVRKLGISEMSPEGARVAGFCYLLLCVGAMGLVLYRRPKSPSAIYPMVNVLAVVLAGVMLFQVVLAYGPWPGSASAAAAPPDDFKTIQAAGRTLPDVYHIVLDGFGRPDVLSRMYGLDLSAFVSALRAREFDVGDATASANYVQTDHSLASVLNARYVQQLSEQPPTAVSRVPLDDLIQHSAVMETFKRLGYEITVIGSIYPATQTHRLADRCHCDLPLIGVFESTLIHCTPFGDIGLGGVDHRPHRNKVLRSFELLDTLPASDRPRFLLAHLMTPHPPFVLDASGNAISPARTLTFVDANVPWPEYQRGYRDQATYVARRMIGVVDHLVEISRSRGREAAIVFHGDHGPRSRFDAEDATKTDATESLPVFLALRWSGGRPPAVAVKSLVNLYRVFFNRYFDAGLSLLPDQAFVSSFVQPYRFIEADIP